MIELVPMTEKEFKVFLEHSIHDYAESKARAGAWSKAEALTRSRREHKTLLRDGLRSKHHHLYTIRESQSGGAVGVLWFRAKLESAAAPGFIFDIEIHEAYRRKGYARQAMQQLEEIARKMGLRQLELHVFAFNEGARSLYEGLGYTVASFNMSKRL
jgi:ribosomal protein S18 acetylase RimI-like enzyme